MAIEDDSTTTASRPLNGDLWTSPKVGAHEPDAFFVTGSAALGIRDDELFAVSGLTAEKSVVGHFWNGLLGCLAFADFSAAMARRHAADVAIEPTSDNLQDTVILWLCQHANALGMLFSLVWFMDAFVGAHRKHMEAARKHDKQMLLDSDKPWDDIEDVKEWWRGFQGVYYRTIALQILLLPVGFFVFWYNRIRELQDPLVGDDSVITFVHHTEDDTVPDDLEVFSPNASVSLGFVVLEHLTIALARRTGTQVRLRAMAKAKRLAYKIAIRGLRHPIRFNRRVKWWLSVIRWIQYLAPLVGTGNKLKGNVSNLLAKYKQLRDTNKAKLIRKKIFNDMLPEERREYCAILVQKTFRAHQARKLMYLVKLLLGQQESRAAIQLQCAFRGSLARARARLKGRLKMLKTLKEKEKESLKKKTHVEMSMEERRHMYVLQEELESEAQSLINEKLLLRPNTRFAVMWKILFVMAVIFEISTLACQPLLARHKDPVTGEPLDLEAILDKKLIPTPVFKLEVCTGKTPIDFKLRRPIESVRRLVKVLLGRLQKKKAPRPWYCQGSYSRFQAVYIYFADLAIHRFLVILSIICFVDVYIEFFTGQYDKETGQLKPPPFFDRWVFPGLLLQLLVNPSMDMVSDIITNAMAGLIYHGPVRILRWTLALFYPVFLWAVCTVRRLWFWYAVDQNRKHAIHPYQYSPRNRGDIGI